MSIDHYENFPVASWLLPKRLRAPIATIYHFARSADDLADEGDATNEARLASLNAYRDELGRIAENSPPTTLLFEKLASVINSHQLPLKPFYDLLSAFEQDVSTHRYEDFQVLRDYCARSANPVGELVLRLAGKATPSNLQRSNHICSALQIINFLQDVAIDWRKGRVYIPQQELALFDLCDEHLGQFSAGTPCTQRWRDLMSFQTKRARKLMLAGAPLVFSLQGRLRWEIALTVEGGLRILEKIDAQKGDIFQHRPTLTIADWVRMIYRAIQRQRSMTKAQKTRCC